MSTEADIVERIEAERTARASDPLRPANPLLAEAKAEIEHLRDELGEAALECEILKQQITKLRADLATEKEESTSYHRFWIEQRDEVAKLRAERDAAARDMRERCAKVALNSYNLMFPKPRNRITAENAGHAVAKAIRALPSTVIATDGKDAT